uniref:WD repeat-containing protein 18 n=1 Tax=Fundulus heteroclitus TaxID=8078 RepID=A0A3Q2QLS2_FUNHE
MAAPLEVVISSDSVSQLWNCTVFDLHSGSSLLSYRGGNSAARGLAVLRGEFLLSAQLGKNFINVWEIQRKDSCPGAAQWVALLPFAARRSWVRVLGLSAWALHVLPVHAWVLSRCSSFLPQSRNVTDRLTGLSKFSSGENVCETGWLSCLCVLDISHAPEPRHILSRHSLPITDLHCGHMGAQARVATSSLDRTVKVWELSSGELLLSVLFDVEIMSVTFDPSEYFLFCGGRDGNILQVSLCGQGLTRERSFQSDSEGNQVLKGHRNLVTCLSVSMDGTLLVSGSHDETVRLWDIQSRQSVRCLAHKGPVTNAVIMAVSANMFLPDSRPAIPLPRFSRHLHASEGSDGEAGEVCVRPARQAQVSEESYLQKADRLYSLMRAVSDKSVLGDGENTKVRVAELEEEVQTLKKVNKDLFEFSSQLLTKPTESH